MRLFCDESGDPGRSTDAGASRWFAVGMLCCLHGSEAMRLADAQDAMRLTLGWEGEFKWSKMPADLRMRYMSEMAPLLSSHRVAIWDKRDGVIRRDQRPEIEIMMRCYGMFGPQTSEVRVVVDGERDRRRSAEIRKALGVGEVRMERSHACPQLQMADMLVGFHVYAWREGWRNAPKKLRHMEANLTWCR